MQDNNNLRTLHDGYQAHKRECARNGEQPLEYICWLEQVTANSLAELAHYQHAAEVNHRHWMDARNELEKVNAEMTSVRMLLEMDRFHDAAVFVGSVNVWN